MLADGPDPGIDPVGYAQAQVLPLRQLHSSDPALRIAISRLARAYQRFSATQGNGAGERQAVRAAVRKLNASCPGAAS